LNLFHFDRKPAFSYYSCGTLPQTTTILLNDLLPLMRSTAAPLRVDVEGHEVNVFTESSAGQFFHEVVFRLVFMEWKWRRSFTPLIVHRILAFFGSRNYIAFNTQII